MPDFFQGSLLIVAVLFDLMLAYVIAKHGRKWSGINQESTIKVPSKITIC